MPLFTFLINAVSCLGLDQPLSVSVKPGFQILGIPSNHTCTLQIQVSNLDEGYFSFYSTPVFFQTCKNNLQKLSIIIFKTKTTLQS